MARQKTIMVAIRDPEKTDARLMRKAIAIAKQQNAALQLIHVIALPHAPLRRARPNVKQAARDEYQERSAKLERLAERLADNGVPVRAHVEWDYPVAHALARAAQKHKPSMLLIQPHRQTDLGRLWLANLDWEVLRTVPCPVWVVKTTKATSQLRVLAAVDPFHAHDKPKPLDDVILRRAIEAAGDERRVFVCHAVPEHSGSGDADGLEREWVKSQDPDQVTRPQLAWKSLEKLCNKYDIPTRNIIIQAGEPKYVIPVAVDHCKANVIVMGAVSRSALKRMFIGATAEELLDELSCDVLVVKPQGFQPDIPARPQPQSALAYA